MIYDDKIRSFGGVDQNKDRLRRDAEKDTALAKQKIQIEEQRRKKLKSDEKKREIDELTRKIALKESLLRNSNSELFLLNAKKRKEEMELEDLKQETKVQNFSASATLVEKTTALKRTEQDIDLSESEMTRKKTELAKKNQDKENLKREVGNLERELTEKTARLKKMEQDADMIESDLVRKKNDLAKKFQAEENLKREASLLERESKTNPYSNKEAGIRAVQNNLTMTQRRISAVDQDIKKGNSEILSLKSELQRKSGELRALAG